MSQQEFETYLDLLCRLLRIAPAQRQHVAEEFRTHMEDRLDDLLSRGISRDKAIEMALEEFGDAAGLANQIATISWNRKRRWYMKVSAFGIAGLAVAGLLTIALWPDNPRIQATSQAVAQQPAAKGKAKPKAAPSAATLEQKLARRLDADFSSIPLSDVLDFLATSGDVQFYINRRAIEDESVTLDVPINIKLKNVRLDTLLDLVLDQASANLAYQERDSVLIVSTLTALEGAREVRVYNCRDLLAMTSPQPGMMGPGMMMPGMPGMPGGDMIPGMPGAPGGAMMPRMPGMRGGGFGAGGVGLPGPSPAIQDGTPGGIELPPPSSLPPGEPRSGDSVPPQPGAGTAAPPPGVPSTEPSAAPAAPADPRPLSRPRGGTSIKLWKDRAILAQGAAGGEGAPSGPGMMPGAHPGMPGMMGGGMGGLGGMAMAPGRREPQTDHERRAQRLMDLITTAVDPESWQPMGGFGTISEYEGLIVVNHNARTHKEIEKVLTMLREAAGLPTVPAGRPIAGAMGGFDMGPGAGGGFGTAPGAPGPEGPGGIGVHESPRLDVPSLPDLAPRDEAAPAPRSPQRNVVPAGGAPPSLAPQR